MHSYFIQKKLQAVYHSLLGVTQSGFAFLSNLSLKSMIFWLHRPPFCLLDFWSSFPLLGLCTCCFLFLERPGSSHAWLPSTFRSQLKYSQLRGNFLNLPSFLQSLIISLYLLHKTYNNWKLSHLFIPLLVCYLCHPTRVQVP